MMHKLLTVLALTLAAPNLAWSHEDAPHKAKTEKKAISTEEKAFGREGDPKKVDRTIKVDMGDTMRYSPSEITVKKGETLRIEAKNSGKLMHEIVHPSAGASAPSAAPLTEGEVRKVDKDAQKMTIRHGPIENLGMPAMTMVFQVKDPSVLDQVKVGDKIRFSAEKVGNAYTLTEVQSAK